MNELSYTHIARNISHSQFHSYLCPSEKFIPMKKLWFAVGCLLLFIVAVTVAFCYLDYNHG
jgi:hypothetical protein